MKGGKNIFKKIATQREKPHTPARSSKVDERDHLTFFFFTCYFVAESLPSFAFLFCIFYTLGGGVGAAVAKFVTKTGNSGHFGSPRPTLTTLGGCFRLFLQLGGGCGGNCTAGIALIRGALCHFVVCGYLLDLFEKSSVFQ